MWRRDGSENSIAERGPNGNEVLLNIYRFEARLWIQPREIGHSCLLLEPRGLVRIGGAVPLPCFEAADSPSIVGLVWNEPVCVRREFPLYWNQRFAFFIKEKSMELKLNKEQYEKLLTLVYLGNWMINAYRTDDYLEDYSDIVSHIFSRAEEAGLEGKVVKDEAENKYLPSYDFEESMQDFISEYDSFCFWEELINRLAERDAVREFGSTPLDKIDLEEYLEKKDRFLRKYEQEVEENGIRNLELVKNP